MQSNGKAIASLVLGLVGIVAWIIPLIGFPVTIVGLILGIVGRNCEKKGLAVAGIVLSAIFLAVTLFNSILGAIIGINAVL